MSEPLTAEQRRANVEAVQDAERRLVKVRDQLATAQSMIGPLFREVAEIQESLAAVLAVTRPDPVPGGAGKLEEPQEVAEFAGEEAR